MSRMAVDARGGGARDWMRVVVDDGAAGGGGGEDVKPLSRTGRARLTMGVSSLESGVADVESGPLLVLTWDAAALF